MDLGGDRIYDSLGLCAGLIAYQIGGLIAGELSFGAGTVAAVALLAGIIYLLVRKGYVPEEGRRNLTSVDAAAY